MNISPCASYHGIIEECRTVIMPDGVSVFKVYFVSIVGRPTPERFEWSKNPLSKEEFIDRFRAMPFEGVGFVTAFPHITKVFRYAPKSEVLLHVTAFKPATGEAISLDRGEGFTEFACLAEAVVANDEFKAWAKAPTVKEYLSFTSSEKDLPILSNTKLAEYVQEKA